MKLIVFSIAMFFWAKVFGQFYYANYQKYTAKDGLVWYESSARISKDKTGFLWIASDNGLYRFDGQNFKSYRYNPNRQHSLPSNNIIFLYQDKQGRYWVSIPQKGLYIFNPVTEEFIPWHPKNKPAGLPELPTYNYMFEDRSGNLWSAINFTGIARLNTTDTTLQVYPTCKGNDCGFFSSSFISNMTELPNGHFLMASNKGLIEFDPVNGEQIIYTDNGGHEKPGNYRQDNLFTSLLPNGKNNIWCGTWGGGLRNFDLLSKKFTGYIWEPYTTESNKNIITSMAIKSDGDLWIVSADGGLMVFDKIEKKFLKVKKPTLEAKREITPGNSLLDEENILWIASSDGLIKINPRENLFSWVSLLENTNVKNIRADVNCFAHLPGDSIYYVGAVNGNGFFSWNSKTKTISSYYKTGMGKDLTSVNDLVFDKENRLWICSYEGIYLFDTRKKKFIPSPLSAVHGFNDQQEFNSILQLTDSTYWLATSNKGIYHYNPAKASIEHYYTAASAEKKLPSNSIFTLFSDKQGNIWFGMGNDKSIGCITNQKKIIIYYNADNGFPAGNCRSICQTKEGKIFYALKGTGLCVLENPMATAPKLTIHNSTNGFPVDRILTLFRDKDDYVWMSTANGLLKCESSSMNCTQYSSYDGLERNLTFSKFFQDEQGQMYIGYSGGFHIFDPQQLQQKNTQLPKVLIHSFTLKGKEFNGNINTLKELHLQYDEAPINFEFAALGFTDNPFIQYAYKLEGLDNDWIYTGTKRYAAYSALKGGQYVLRIKAANRNGTWNENAFRLTIIVHPPFWETWWFTTLAVLLLVIVIFVFVRKRIARIRKEAMLKQLKAEAEMKALRAQMNPHFIFNCMNTIDAYIHQNNTTKASGFLNKFSQLIRATLENSQYPFISLQKEIQALQLYITLEEQRHNNNFTYRLQIPDSILSKGYKIPPLLIQPYVENAILHGLRHKAGDGLLKITFSEKENYLCCTIEDNGIGRKAAAAISAEKKLHSHQSLGTKISSNRLEAINYLHQVSSSVEITDKNSNGESGVIVNLFLPKIT